MGAAPESVQQWSVERGALGGGETQNNSVETHIVEFTEPGALHYRGDEVGLAATAGHRDANGKFEANALAVVAYRQYLRSRRAAQISAINYELARQLDVTHHYSVLSNGIAAKLSAQEAERVARLPGVKSVQPAGFQRIDSYRSWEFLEADKVWSGESTPDGGVAAPQGLIDRQLQGPGTLGNGVVIGVLDTGSAAAHPSFANQPSCGHNANNPKLIALDCSHTDGNGYCAGPDPEAASGNGHGVHVAAVAAGNIITNQAMPAPLIGDGRQMAGIAPCATIRSYKVCQTNICSGADIEAGITSALIDGVDVINFSISGGNNPWLDHDRGLLGAVGNGTFVAASAGNTDSGSPNPVGAVSHLGPWLTTVASSSHDEMIGPQLLISAPAPVPESIRTIVLTPGSTTDFATTPDLNGLELAMDPDNLTGCADGGFSQGFFSGKAAVMMRGTCAFAEKINNAYLAGAIIVVIGNNQPGSFTMDTAGTAPIHAFSMGDLEVATGLRDFILANPGSDDADVIFASSFEVGEISGVRARYRRARVSSRLGYVLSEDSLRGPTGGLYHQLTKPDITAPGADIYAATDLGSGGYGVRSGASIATAQVAGAGALIRGVHPSWSADEIKSALMTTARIEGFSDDGTTPWTFDDVGSGHVNVALAVMAGLTLDETILVYRSADPAPVYPTPSHPYLAMDKLNTPSLRNVECLEGGCSWTRTVKNRLPTAGTWQTSYLPHGASGLTATVSPANFTLQPGQTQEITITATPADSEGMQFGHVFLTETSEQSPQQHLTVTVRAAELPETVVCQDGVCGFQVDDVSNSVFAFGCDTPCPIVWLNQFTPDPDDFPITITKLRSYFSGLNDWVVQGDRIDVYIYIDDDDDPSNGATLVGSFNDWIVEYPFNRFEDIDLYPITVSGGKHVLIALASQSTNAGTRPAFLEDTGLHQGARSWIGHYGGEAPDLALPAVGLQRMDEAGFTGNWLIRAEGVNGVGSSLDLPAK